MTTLVVGGIVVSVAIVALWVVRTTVAERQAGQGRGQRVRRGRPVKIADLGLWVLGVAWAALLASFFVLTLTGA